MGMRLDMAQLQELSHSIALPGIRAAHLKACQSNGHWSACSDSSATSPEQGACALQDCLQAFTEVEELSGDDSHVCERCRSKQPTTKALRICRCPPVLVLHLKRFSMHASPLYISPFEKVSHHSDAATSLWKGRRILSLLPGTYEEFRRSESHRTMGPAKPQNVACKCLLKDVHLHRWRQLRVWLTAASILMLMFRWLQDSTQVCIAETLDVSPYCTPAASKAYPRPVYDLFGLVCHSGTLAGGHYTALTRKSSSEAWINHNDSFTSGEKPALKESRSAYLLFYSLRTS